MHIYVYIRMNFESQIVNGRPIPKEPLSFFQFSEGSRFFISITDNTKAWQDDIIIAEKIFADMIVCPFITDNTSMENHSSEMNIIKDVLKQRLRYPNIVGTQYEKLARTWVLPNKVNLGPIANDFLQSSESSVLNTLGPIFETLKNDDSKIHVLKIELSSGLERQMLYKFLDNGFRPSLLLVKWSYDLDDHLPTAHCAGHLINSGYSFVAAENEYALYMFSDRPLYDTTSMKTLGLDNPFMKTILQSVSESMKPSN